MAAAGVSRLSPNAPAEAKRYAALKRKLANDHRSNRAAYTDAKAAFVAGIMAKVGREP
jgi:GrpB-like predicted nucleotidyltransferase (UPF0157 family)